MPLRVLTVVPLFLNRPVNLDCWNFAFLGAAVCNHRFGLMKKIEQPIVHVLAPNPKLVNSVSQEIGFRPAQLVPDLFKAPDPIKQFISRIVRDSVEPEQYRAFAIDFREEKYISPGHDQAPSFFTKM
ncbi:MAG TPA: hypothetical protein VFW23_03710 [Tepidisphaeraceae bacterium]|nr:hypothetical protein [Tepidisphaeraceae bacterium]